MIEDLEALPRVCRKCCLHEGETEEKLCPVGSDTCKHQFVKQTMWAGLVTSVWFDVRSLKTAKSLFGESCFDPESYEDVRQISVEEAQLIRAGKARLVISIEPVGKI
jgi:hypothetical protein